MEEIKLNVPLLSQRYGHLEVVQWQFQSDLHPYKEENPAQWTWQNYSDDENLILEEAYSLNQETVDLKDYEIDFKKMVQVTLKDKTKVRRVRRQEPSRFMMKMPEVKDVKRDQKTMNEAFGTVQHFLEYVMKRTPEAYTLYQKLKTFPLDCNRDEFEDLVQQVLLCIAKGAEVRTKIIKTRAGSHRAPNYILEAKKITDMIENNSKSLQDFFKAILKTYTMETFICYWLNELLRSEDWEEINVLTPYLVCLVYAFKLSDFVLQSLKPHKTINDRLGFVVKHRLYLYRGAALTEEQLLSYNPNRTKYFSWNAVTSTSRDRNIARNFVDLSLTNRANIGVMFFIEIDFDSIEDYHGMIDISKDSRYPNEQEVILAPGTVFKLLEISLIENNVYEIRLKIIKDFKGAHENIALLGPQQDQLISKDKAIIDGLPSEESFQMLELIKGNKLIKKLEIRNSGIEESIMEDLENFRVTTNVKKEDIKLMNNTIVISSLSVLAHYFSLDNLSDILAENKVRLAPGLARHHQILPKLQVQNLMIKDKTIEMFRKNNHDHLKDLWRGLIPWAPGKILKF